MQINLSGWFFLSRLLQFIYLSHFMDPFPWIWNGSQLRHHRLQGDGVVNNPDSSHDQIQSFWLAEVRNFTNIMI